MIHFIVGECSIGKSVVLTEKYKASRNGICPSDMNLGEKRIRSVSISDDELSRVNSIYDVIIQNNRVTYIDSDWNNTVLISDYMKNIITVLLAENTEVFLDEPESYFKKGSIAIFYEMLLTVNHRKDIWLVTHDRNMLDLSENCEFYTVKSGELVRVERGDLDKVVNSVRG